ncbi:N-formylglutamate amidohydrolase [Legionella lansingensis]|uniref:N-formylglutamate amidohydrolase n=1 Tax=Legionella lansingensis TaxID=45067 RepID=A0A0W0VG60_9GAMM|nr:N-formylglutamate amidohydrolase [Legionella lansingensis]KTD19134.1 N-formylglutamate amidohydrolase [Legionella lansingensis]SNV45568.1 N-formylglutamate amidohydrolase [Legionella lansingensis]
MKPPVLVLSCEHAVNTVPEKYTKYFAEYKDVLQTHRGVDLGALTIANHLSQVFACDIVCAQATRLLIDCNRRLSNPYVFSEITRNLTSEEKAHIIQEYYLPFREQLISTVRKHINAGQQVWHLSIHSFTPVFNDLVRDADIGLLYDPKRSDERMLAKEWQLRLKSHSSALRVRMNYPYRGVTDGFTSFLRPEFTNDEYLGLEVEANQALTTHPEASSNLCDTLAVTLKTLLRK